MKTEIKACLCLSLLVHVAAVGIALYAVNAAAAYWSHFLTSVPFPRLFPFLAASVRWLPWTAVVIVAAGVAIIIKGGERLALRVMTVILLLSITILSLTAVAMAQPLAVAARLMDKQTANHTSEVIR